ncbi:hypothetical protein NCLIV_006550 [Neospora caninum Liverpool]|uniref:Phospholipid/glycerol acyltransferase domain-containing protein n=1 Tax=Neospora caninum (strain Liverpool) TaxID=572307 RepID=F0V8Y8_NEOCL|nr:hypothetical protein NCLIV_006550 [Neospora caninum Liverpool]CBZ50179.1 hypothetical protein NCLIV_006550 [Neospora caninum Liverpool]|eukprot:XP_003880214.1 hypothetical protein NCLIV_006550 [Neospora caninum Liverpool]
METSVETVKAPFVAPRAGPSGRLTASAGLHAVASPLRSHGAPSSSRLSPFASSLPGRGSSAFGNPKFLFLSAPLALAPPLRSPVSSSPLSSPCFPRAASLANGGRLSSGLDAVASPRAEASPTTEAAPRRPPVSSLRRKIAAFSRSLSFFGLHFVFTSVLTGGLWWAALRALQAFTALALSPPALTCVSLLSRSWRSSPTRSRAWSIEELQDWSHRTAWKINTLWGATFSRLVGCVPEIRGSENLPPASEKVIFVANHCSLMDVAYIAAAVPRSLRFVAKVELLDAPVVGLAMRLSGCPTVDRQSPTSHLALFREALRLLKQKQTLSKDAGVASASSDDARERPDTPDEDVALVAFPEGTRSVDGRLKPFDKGGVFRLARQTGVRVVPLTVTGTHLLLPANSFLPPGPPPKGSLQVVIHPPLASAGKSPDELREDAWRAIASALPPGQLPQPAAEEPEVTDAGGEKKGASS